MNRSQSMPCLSYKNYLQPPKPKAQLENDQKRISKNTLTLLSSCLKGHSDHKHQTLRNTFWEYVNGSKVTALEDLLKSEPCTHQFINEPKINRMQGHDHSLGADICDGRMNVVTQSVATAFCTAIESGEDEMVALLIEHGADTNMCREQRLAFGQYNVLPHGATEAVAQPASFSQGQPCYKEHPLHLALSLHNDAIAKQIINVDETNLEAEHFTNKEQDRDGHGESLLVTTIRFANFAMFRALLIKQQSKHGMQSIRQMVNAGFIMKPLDRLLSGYYPADKDKKLLMLAYLLNFGVEINAINLFDQLGQTALHIAVSKRWPEACELLIALGADTAKVNAHGLTPERAAEELGFHELMVCFDKGKNVPSLSVIADESARQLKGEDVAGQGAAVATTGVPVEDRQKYLDAFIRRLEEKLRRDSESAELSDSDQ